MKVGRTCLVQAVVVARGYIIYTSVFIVPAQLTDGRSSLGLQLTDAAHRRIAAHGCSSPAALLRRMLR